MLGADCNLWFASNKRTVSKRRSPFVRRNSGCDQHSVLYIYYQRMYVHQYHVVDTHSEYCEVNPKQHRSMNLKIMKHVADTHWDMLFDTVICTPSLVIANI